MKAQSCLPVLLGGLMIVTGCRRDMFTQPKANPLRESSFFPDGSSARPIPDHALSQEQLPPDDPFLSGMSGTNLVTTFPMPVTQDLLNRGRERFAIYCGPCHGLDGNGDGMVVWRGLPAAPPFSIDRLRDAPVGHFVDVVARGYGIMLPQGAQVTPQDRWAIAAYIRVLQFSQHASLTNLSPDDVAKLNAIP